MVLQSIILVTNFRYMVWLSTILWLVFLLPANFYLFFYKNPFGVEADFEIGLLLLVFQNGFFLLEFFYLANYERYLSVPWGYLLIPVLLLALIIGLGLGVYCYYLNKDG